MPRHVFGRLNFSVGDVDFTCELRKDGLHVRKKFARMTKKTVIGPAQLSRYVDQQFELFPSHETKTETGD